MDKETLYHLFVIIILGLVFLPWLFIFYIIEKDEKRRKEEEKEKRRKYDKSEFFKQTKLSYKQMDDDQGVRGEYTMFSILDEVVELKHFIVNCCVEIDRPPGYTEIDLVMFHPTGIYVFESKNRKGTIEGSVDGYEWTQTLGSKEHTFYNPLMQNNAHITAMKNAYKTVIAGRWHNKRPPPKDEAFVSIIAFSDDSFLRIEKGFCFRHPCVIHYKDLAETIKRYIESRPEIMSMQETIAYYYLYDTMSGSPEKRYGIKKKIKAYQDTHRHNH